jgi:hypothetical protein
LNLTGFAKKLMKNQDNLYRAYLFAYFTGNAKQDEALHFAISDDGLRYRALHANKPVLDSAKISSTGGVRDPHILRSADGNTFYMVATDMVSGEGWESNRAMVLLKSYDLITWTSTVINIQQRFAGNEALQRVWAPQTIYDAQKNKYIIYWSMKHGTGPDKIYFSYANESFTDLETIPQQLFHHPHNQACIYADIVLKDDRYYLFFKIHEATPHIAVAVSDTLTEGYAMRNTQVEQTSSPAEGPCVFRLNNGEGYILMYDLYMHGRYQFTKSNDLENFTVIDKDVSMDFQPRHGSVMPITEAEKKKLLMQWGKE